jgi:antitoxin MazE
MLTKLQKWGNSQGLRVSKAVLEEAKLKVGDEVSVSVQGQRIVIESVTKIRGKYRLKDLVSKMPKNHKTEEVDWGTPAGKEEW